MHRIRAATFILLTATLLAMACGDDSDLGVGSGSGRDLSSGEQAPSFSDSGSSDGAAASLDLQRLVVVNSSIVLEVETIRSAYLEVSRLARTAGGFVADGQLTSDEDGGSADLRLRVPAGRHDEVLDSLRSLEGAKVEWEWTNAQEVTAEYTDLQSSLRNLELAEDEYRKLIGQATRVEDILAVARELRDVRGEIE